MAGKKKKCSSCGGSNSGRISSYNTYAANVKKFKVGETIASKDGRKFKVIDPKELAKKSR